MRTQKEWANSEKPKNKLRVINIIAKNSMADIKETKCANLFFQKGKTKVQKILKNYKFRLTQVSR